MPDGIQVGWDLWQRPCRKLPSFQGAFSFHLQDAEGVLTTTSVSPATPDPLLKGPHEGPKLTTVCFQSNARSKAISYEVGVLITPLTVVRPNCHRRRSIRPIVWLLRTTLAALRSIQTDLRPMM